MSCFKLCSHIFEVSHEPGCIWNLPVQNRLILKEAGLYIVKDRVSMLSKLSCSSSSACIAAMHYFLRLNAQTQKTLLLHSRIAEIFWHCFLMLATKTTTRFYQVWWWPKLPQWPREAFKLLVFSVEAIIEIPFTSILCSMNSLGESGWSHLNGIEITIELIWNLVPLTPFLLEFQSHLWE